MKATGEIGHFDFFFLMAVVTQLLVYWGLGVVAAEFVASSLLGEKLCGNQNFTARSC